jgi:hypothetical protein
MTGDAWSLKNTSLSFLDSEVICMISAPDLQAMVQKPIFANMPASVRQAYDDANANFRRRLSQTVKSAATPATETEAQEAQERAAVVLNLANALKRARTIRTNKTVECWICGKSV